MTVGELEDALARLPRDLPVAIRGGGVGAYHPGTLRKSNIDRSRGWPAVLHIEGSGALWTQPAPPVQLAGRWPCRGRASIVRRRNLTLVVQRGAP